MFGPVLKKETEFRLVYSTSLSFRVLCLSSGIILLLIILSGVQGPFYFDEHLIALSISGICLVSALYLERWIFDKESNLFERHFGLLFLYSKLKRPLDRLECVLLYEMNRDSSQSDTPKYSMLTRRSASLSIRSANNEVFKLDRVNGSGVKELSKTAEDLSRFCEIPLKTNSMDETDSEVSRS